MTPRRAFTLIELLAIIAVLILVVVLLLPLTGRARINSRQVKDKYQIQGIHQGMVLGAQSNGDTYLLPSALDKANQTLAEGEAKDLPRHILSVLIYNGNISPELCVGPAEANAAIIADAAYQYTQPAAAAGDRAQALWDPAFKATPLDADIGHNTANIGKVSYAMMPPLGGRMAMYSNTFGANEAIIGNRGPVYTGGGLGEWSLHPSAPTPTSPGGIRSNTLLIHGGRSTWEGNIVYNDNHVNFETRPDPETLPFTFGGLPPRSQERFDNLFVNENDQTRLPDSETLSGSAGENTNNFLRLWYGATVTEGKMTAIKPWFD
jgi:hypothetical protein